MKQQERFTKLGFQTGQFLEEHSWATNTPKSIRYNAVIDLIKSHDANMAKREEMVKRGEKKKHAFRMRFRSRRNPSSWTISIDNQDIRNVKTIPRPITRHKNDSKHTNRRKWTELSMFKNQIGKLWLTEALPGEIIEHGVKITRNRLGHFHMHVPMSTPQEQIPHQKAVEERKVVALDPGVRAFQTFYSPDNDFGSYAAGQGGFNKVFKECVRCDETITKLSRRDIRRRDRKDLLKAKYRSIERVKNLVNETHKKVAKDLCDNYDTILLPKFETSSMVKKPKEVGDSKRKIGSKTARCMLGWKHFQFREFLASKATMRGKELIIVTEEYTSQCCGGCGLLNTKLGGAKEYVCSFCGFRCGRDENGARNIFIKHLTC